MDPAQPASPGNWEQRAPGLCGSRSPEDLEVRYRRHSFLSTSSWSAITTRVPTLRLLTHLQWATRLAVSGSQ